MPVFALASTERSIFEANEPSADAIGAALRNVTGAQIADAWNNLNPSGPTQAAEWGAWVGPAPRITRRAVIGSGFFTDTTWLWELPDAFAQRAPFLRAALGLLAKGQLQTISGDWTDPVVSDYAPAINGPLDAWRSGQLAVTRTRDEAQTGVARVDPNENARGPTTRDTHPRSPAEAAGDAANAAGGAVLGFAKATAIAGAAVLAAVLGWRWINAAPSTSPRREPASGAGEQARANPTRRRRRHRRH